MTNKQRQAKFRAKMEAAGFIRRSFWFPERYEARVKRLMRWLYERSK